MASGGTIADASLAGGAVLEIQSGGTAGSSTITFKGAGTLILDDSRTFSGTVAGLNMSAFVDLTDIAYSSSSTLGYSDNGAGGILSVSDGVHTAQLALLGQYAAADFTLASDGNGGTLISDPAVASPVDTTPPLAGGGQPPDPSPTALTLPMSLFV